MEDLHTRSVDHLAERGAEAARQGACPLETWSQDLSAFVDRRSEILGAMHQISPGEARGMALAGLISGRPGSWEASELVQMARARFVPLVELPPLETTPFGDWHTWQIDGGQVLADALARLAEGGAAVPDDSYFRRTSFAISTTV